MNFPREIPGPLPCATFSTADGERGRGDEGGQSADGCPLVVADVLRTELVQAQRATAAMDAAAAMPGTHRRCPASIPPSGAHRPRPVRRRRGAPAGFDARAASPLHPGAAAPGSPPGGRPRDPAHQPGGLRSLRTEPGWRAACASATMTSMTERGNGQHRLRQPVTRDALAFTAGQLVTGAGSPFAWCSVSPSWRRSRKQRSRTPGSPGSRVVRSAGAISQRAASNSWIANAVSSSAAATSTTARPGRATCASLIYCAKVLRELLQRPGVRPGHHGRTAWSGR
jgi:hypothetical protein